MDEYYQERDGEDRIYIKFEADNIVNEQEDNIDRFADACTSQKIPAQNIKVCVLRNNSTGKITYRREDIVTYMMSACSIEDIKSKYLLDDRLSNQLEEYYADRQAEVMDLTEYTLEEMGFDVESSHHEKAPAQHEIDFREAEPLQIADSIIT